MKSLDVLDEAAGSEFALLLRELRTQACLTQEELAEKSGLSIRAISDLERGRTSTPHRRSVALLAEALRVEGDSLESFRRTARRRPGTHLYSMAVGHRPSTTTPVSAVQQHGGLSALIEWMRQVLIEEPGGQHQAEAAGSAEMRLVELVGVPGPAKTAVVVQAAARFQRHFPDGQFYVSAEAGQPGADVLTTRLSWLLGIDPCDGATPEEKARRVRSALRSRRALVVLENVTDATHIRPLLPRGGSCAIIVTAPRRLAAFEGVWTIDVPAATPAQVVHGAPRPVANPVRN
ncbi:helix-turn-helix domain-containing protein [Micromonospora sp. NPDC049171]|uniref:helix-turn-helix domain-containing protein n=1 Tax=Micromonospora sp. NPDC049171 TaxID=3155770 RepID=UPI0033C31970